MLGSTLLDALDFLVATALVFSDHDRLLKKSSSSSGGGTVRGGGGGGAFKLAATWEDSDSDVATPDLLLAVFFFVFFSLAAGSVLGCTDSRASVEIVACGVRSRHETQERKNHKKSGNTNTVNPVALNHNISLSQLVEGCFQPHHSLRRTKLGGASL